MIGLFDQQLPAIVNPVERFIWSSYPRLVRKYIQKLSEYFEDHDIVWKITEIQHVYNYKEVEKQDEMITAGMLYAEWECWHDIRLPWSKKNLKTMAQVNILWIYMSSLRNNIDCTNQIEKKEQSLKLKQYLLTKIKETSELLKAAQKQI